MSRIKFGGNESNRVENHESNKVVNGESDPVGNDELNTVGNGESIQVKNNGQQRTTNANDGASIRYLNQGWAVS